MGRRSAVSSSSTTPAVNPVKDDFPEALTYRYNDNSAWVPAARSHDVSHNSFLFFSSSPPCSGGFMIMIQQEAIDLAKHAYPELRGIRRDRITFHTTGKSSIACITPAAWQLVVRRLPPYHVVDVRIRDPVEDLPLEEECGVVAGGRDAELPEYYPYMAGAAGYAHTIPKEKEERNVTSQKEQPQHQQPQRQQSRDSAAEDGGSRLRRVLSFVRGD